MKTYPLFAPEVAREMAEAVRSLAWTSGKTTGGVSSVKSVGELRQDDEVARPLLDRIQTAIVESPIVQRERIASIFPPRLSRYRPGDHYDIHVDAAFMGPVRTDLALTLFLTDDYEGGELCVELSGGQVATVKAPAGHAVVYECWRPHKVNPVISGERIIGLTWLQSRIQSAEDRELLDRLHMIVDDLRVPKLGDQERIAALGAVVEKLTKRFAT